MTEQEQPAVENKPTPLIGRDQELAELVHMLKTMPPGSVAVVCGPAGVGKTRLVQEAVKQLEGPVEWVDGSKGVVEVIAERRGLGTYDYEGFTVSESKVREWLQLGQLVVVDNVDSASDQERALLLDVSHTQSRLIAVSRDKSLGSGNPSLQLSLNDLPLDFAGALFNSVYRENHRRSNTASVDELVAITGGNPLSVRLAALWLSQRGYREIQPVLDRLDRGGDLVSVDRADQITFPGRTWRSLHESMAASLTFATERTSGKASQWKVMLGTMPTESCSEEVCAILAGTSREHLAEFLDAAWRYGIIERDNELPTMFRVPALMRNALRSEITTPAALIWVRLNPWLAMKVDPSVRPDIGRRHHKELRRDWPIIRCWCEAAGQHRPNLLVATASIAIEKGDASIWFDALMGFIVDGKDEAAEPALLPTAIRLALAAGRLDDARAFLARMEQIDPAMIATREGATLRRQVFGPGSQLLSPQQLELEEAATKLDEVGESALAAQLRAKARALPSKASEETNGIHPTAPIYLQEIELARWRGITKLAPLPFNLPKDKDEGQWIFFLGENGAGKTSLLRAMALALAPDEAVDGILSDLGEQQPHVQAGADEASIKLTLEIAGAGPLPLTREIRRGDQGEQLATRPGGKRPFVVAYGCRRGSQTHSSAKEGNAAKEAILALFSESPTMMDVENWIQLRELDAQKDHEKKGSEGAVVAAVKTALKKLLRLDNIEITGRGLYVSGANVGSVQFSALSDGYRTTAGWALDMMARWLDHARRQKLPLDGDICAEMTGVALVDDIDLHLHPRWQRDLVKDLRSQFPKMSFVVTTHNPLTLLGAKPGEVHVVTRDDDAGVSVQQVDVPPGVGVERLLTGAWFGLDSVIDDETLALLARRRKLLLEPDRDQAELDRLDGILRERLWRHDLTSLERIGEEAAASVLAELAAPSPDGAPKKLGPAKRERALDRIKAEIRRREASTETG